MKTLLKSVFLTALALMMLWFNGLAQTKSLGGVLKVRLRSSGEIVEKNEIKGYYYFYKTDKVDSKTNAYEIKILDANLNDVASEKVVGSKYLYLVEASYNGNNFLFKFYDAKERQVFLQLHDKSGKMIFKNTSEVSKAEGQQYIPNQDDEIEGNSIFVIPNKGFASYTMVQNKNWGYQAEFLSSEGKAKNWQYASDPNSKEVEYAEFLTASEDVIVQLVSKRKSLMSNDATLYVSGLDTESGKKIFEQKLEDTQYQLFPMNAYVNPSGQIVVFGQYYLAKDNLAKAKSVGLFSFVMDKTGNIFTKNYVSWAKDVSAFLPVSAKGKIEDVGYIFFHNIVRASDGKIFAIGEQFRKVASGAGIASALILGANSGMALAKMQIEDIYMFEFTPEFKLAGVKVFDKTKTNVELPQGYGTASTQKLARVLDMYGYFDYSFTQISSQNATFTVGYTDYQKDKGTKKEWIFGALTYVDNQFSQDKISLETESSALRVLPAKPGYVLISEYFKKEKKIDLRLEKVNY
jgi:hypothetical protein